MAPLELCAACPALYVRIDPAMPFLCGNRASPAIAQFAKLNRRGLELRLYRLSPSTRENIRKEPRIFVGVFAPPPPLERSGLYPPICIAEPSFWSRANSKLSIAPSRRVASRRVATLNSDRAALRRLNSDNLAAWCFARANSSRAKV